MFKKPDSGAYCTIYIHVVYIALNPLSSSQNQSINVSHIEMTCRPFLYRSLQLENNTSMFRGRVIGRTCFRAVDERGYEYSRPLDVPGLLGRLQVCLRPVHIVQQGLHRPDHRELLEQRRLLSGGRTRVPGVKEDQPLGGGSPVQGLNHTPSRVGVAAEQRRQKN